MKGQRHYVNHLMFTPDGKRIVMLHRWGDAVKWKTRMNTSNPDGSDMCVLNDDDMTSHFDWRDNMHIVAWARQHNVGDRYFLFTDKSRQVQVVGDGLLTLDGHMTYSPDRKWLLTDYATPHNDWRKQFLLLYHPGTNRRIELGEFSTEKPLSVDMRCDTHPRWNPDGKGVTFDGMLGGRRVVYFMDVSNIVG
jgi:Tol biopolymer transport system component